MTSRDWPQAAPTTRTNPLAIAALVCGIVQFGYLFSKILGLACIAAIILGHMAVRQIRQSGDQGRGLARTGLFLGYAVLAMSLLGVIAVLLVSSGGPVGHSH